MLSTDDDEKTARQMQLEWLENKSPEWIAINTRTSVAHDLTIAGLLETRSGCCPTMITLPMRATTPVLKCFPHYRLSENGRRWCRLSLCPMEPRTRQRLDGVLDKMLEVAVTTPNVIKTLCEDEVLPRRFVTASMNMWLALVLVGNGIKTTEMLSRQEILRMLREAS